MILLKKILTVLGTLQRKYIELLERLDGRTNDEVIVQRFDNFIEILQPGEQIIWQGKPSALHAWADHDQLEPAGSASERPVSLKVRKFEAILALLFILFMFVLGAGCFYSGINEVLEKQDLATVAHAIFLILTGITFMSGLPFILRPLSNSLRARRLTYLLTTARALIVRNDHAWAEIWVRSPVILSVSILILYGVLFFSGIYLEGASQDFLQGAGLNTWMARLFILVFMLPIAYTFTVLGYLGLRFQCVIILDAIKDRHGIFVRSFSFSDIKYHDFPVISRLRKDGVGDVIVGQDGHWEYDIDFNEVPWFKINAVGFLSIADAKDVAEKVECQLARSPA